MDVRNTQEALARLLIQANQQNMPQAVARPELVVESVQVARLQSLLDKIMQSVGQSASKTELAVLKLALFSENIKTGNPVEQQHFLQNLLKLFEEKELTPKQSDFLRDTLNKSEIIKQAFSSLNTTESKTIADLVKKIPVENPDIRLKTELPQELQKIIASKDLEPLIRAWKEITSPIKTENLPATDKKLMQLLLNLVKSAESSHPAANRAETPDIEKVLYEFIKDRSGLNTGKSAQEPLPKNTLPLLRLIDRLPVANEKLSPAVKSDLALSLIKLSVELKSLDFLKSGMEILTGSNISIRSAIEVLIPLARMEAESVQKNQKNILVLEQKTIINNRATATENQPEKLAEKLTKLLPTENEKQLTETLNKLNEAANKLNLPNYQILQLPFATKPAELNFRPLKNSVNDKQDSSAGNQKEAENLECTIDFPRLGAVNIKISLLDKNVGIALSTESGDSCREIEKEFSALSASLVSQGFEKPILGILQKKAEQLKPDWLLELMVAHSSRCA